MVLATVCNDWKSMMITISRRGLAGLKFIKEYHGTLNENYMNEFYGVSLAHGLG